MIGIRADGNSKIATGHIMRCLSLANGFRKMGLECIFITADETGKSFLSRYEFKVVCLNSQWDNLDKEAEQMVEVIFQYNIDKLIIDSYYVTYEYLKTIQTYTKVIYIDDLNLFLYPVAMIINYNIYHTLFSYQKTYNGKDIQLLLGCEFAPLRDEFIGNILVSRVYAKKVLFTTGGTDQYNIIGKIMKRIINDDFFKEIEFHIIVGSLNRNYEYLNKLSDCDSSSIVLHKNVKDMATLMMTCDIAITAGGFTMYELCACGIPSITFSFADNQVYGVKGFEKEGIMAYAGDIRLDKEKCLSTLIDHLKKYIKSAEERKQRSIKMKNLVDGEGVKRIVEAIIEL